MMTAYPNVSGRMHEELINRIFSFNRSELCKYIFIPEIENYIRSGSSQENNIVSIAKKGNKEKRNF